MLDASDPSTIKAIQRLLRVVRRKERPVVLWVGAGVSTWAGYPLWPELADHFHSEYLRGVDGYDADRASHYQSAGRYPEFFSLCKELDQALYFRLLAENLGRRQAQGPVHRRFSQLVDGLQPIGVITTNVDEALESALPGLEVLQRSDLDRAADLLRQERSFFCKLHGTMSAAETVVFTKEDYDDILADSGYQELLRLAFNLAAVVFIGYGLADQYVLDALRRSDGTMRIVGSGPHFLLTDRRDLATGLPRAIHVIRYLASPHEDHRSPLQVIDMIRSARPDVRIAPSTSAPELEGDEDEPGPAETRSSYYIADLYPPGTWTTSQDVNASGQDGSPRNILVGQGFDDRELGKQPSRALHDLAVGLLCFDQTYLPLSAMARVHDLLGSERFWRTHEQGALRFVHLLSSPAIIFPSQEEVAGGDLGLITRGFTDEMRAWTVDDVIEAELRAIPGREREADALFESLKGSTVTLEHEGDSLPMTARTALLHPRLQGLIGLSDAIPPTALPRWLAFPALRLLHVVQAADVCRCLGIPTLKIPFGGERLMTAVIGAGQSAYSADELAGYLVLQRGTGDLGAAIEAQPQLLDVILAFRSTAVGQQLRAEVVAALDVVEGTELEAAVNGGMRQALPVDVLDRAIDKLEELLVPKELPSRPRSPAIWADVAYSDGALRSWRRRSRERFETYREEKRLGPYDDCPCGSMEKLRFCCEAALKE